MELEGIIILRIFFITVFVLQIAVIIKRIFLVSSKSNNTAYYTSVCYYPAVLLFLISNIFYIVSEITGWRGYSNSITFTIAFMIVADMISLVLFVVLTRKLYEVHIVYRPIKKKMVDIDKSFVVVYDIIGRKEVIYLDRINPQKSEYVQYKQTSFLALFLNKAYAHFILGDNREIKIQVANYIDDPEIGLFEVRHILKIPLSTVVNGKKV